ncbi:MAG: PqqD family protein [Bacteroidetes bacterium]|nr:PqqD family protein [Bacteroidota bacterium]
MKIKKNVAISDSGFIFNPETGESYTANPMAVEMLGMIKEGKEKNEILRSVKERYHVDNITLEKDYNDFMAMLQRFQLLVDHE